MSAPTIAELRDLAKRYRVDDLDAAGELLALGTIRQDEYAQAFGHERMNERDVRALGRAREKGEVALCNKLARAIEEHARAERAAARQEKMREELHVLCPTRVDGEWIATAEDVLRASSGIGPFALVAFADDVYTIDRSRLLHFARSLSNATEVAWRFVHHGPSTFSLAVRYRGAHGSRGRAHFALGMPIAGEDLCAYLPDDVAPTDEVRRTFGRAFVVDVAQEATSIVREALEAQAAAVEAAPPVASKRRRRKAAPEAVAPVVDAAAELEAAKREQAAVEEVLEAQAYAEADAPPLDERAPAPVVALPVEPPSADYERGRAAASWASPEYVRGFLAAVGASMKAPKRTATVVTSDELVARRKEAARKAVETRRARLAARGVDETAHYRSVS